MSRKKLRILAADDEPKYVRVLQVILEAAGYEVLEARDGLRALELAASQEPDLCLLDIKMPGLDGYEVCRRIREFSTAPIIMLTALAETADKVRGLEAGADDYVTKPFSAEELTARVRAALRRVEMSGREQIEPVMRAGELEIDFTRQRVMVANQVVGLTPIEYRLLCELARHKGQVLAQDVLLERVWGHGYGNDGQLLRQAIHRLRQKIESDSQKPHYIRVRPGFGYEFDVSDT